MGLPTSDATRAWPPAQVAVHMLPIADLSRAIPLIVPGGPIAAAAPVSIVAAGPTQPTANVIAVAAITEDVVVILATISVNSAFPISAR